MSMRCFLGVTAAVVLVGAPATAAVTEFSGTLDLRAGYGSNPFLTSNNSNGGSVLLGGTLSGGLTSRAALSTTTLTGVADIEQNLHHYGRSENYTVGLSRSQKLSERLTINGNVNYANTINPGVSYSNTFSSGAIFQNAGVVTPIAAVPGDAVAVTASPVTLVPVGAFDTSNLDLFTLGQRSERYGGDAGLTWTPTARDQISLSGNASRVHYKSFNGNYDQYGGGATYLRTLSQNTRVGIDGSVEYVDSQSYPTATSYTANLVLIQRLSAIWSLNARVGGILPRGGLGQNTGLTLGFSGSLCGDYTRRTICFTASRQSAPTGIGGLRTDLQFGATLSYELDEHSRVNVAANYDHSGAVATISKQNFYQASGGYSHDVSRRVAIGASGRYQKRVSGGTFGTASGYAVTVDVITRFGHAAQ